MRLRAGVPGRNVGSTKSFDPAAVGGRLETQVSQTADGWAQAICDCEGRMIYKDYQRNHVIVPGREDALASFLRQDYQGMRHKLRNANNSNSEDALTWSCFDVLASLPS